MGKTQAQIASFRAQIADYTQKIQDLGIPALQVQLSTVLDSLQLAYNAYNNANVDLTPFNLNITINMQSINNLTQQKSKTKKQIVSDEKSLDDTNTLIASLEQQLAAARANK